MTAVRIGGPCTCTRGRYVRFAIPRMPGVESGLISCRGVDVAKGDVREHEFPSGAALELRLAPLT